MLTFFALDLGLECIRTACIDSLDGIHTFFYISATHYSLSRRAGKSTSLVFHVRGSGPMESRRPRVSYLLPPAIFVFIIRCA